MPTTLIPVILAVGGHDDHHATRNVIDFLDGCARVRSAAASHAVTGWWFADEKHQATHRRATPTVRTVVLVLPSTTTSNGPLLTPRERLLLANVFATAQPRYDHYATVLADEPIPAGVPARTFGELRDAATQLGRRVTDAAHVALLPEQP
jgi:hypothetical protein